MGILRKTKEFGIHLVAHKVVNIRLFAGCSRGRRKTKLYS
jgi:hypothetical protein